MNVFELVAVLSLNKKDYEQGLKSASDEASTFGSKLKSGLGTVAKVGGVMLSATTGAVVAFGKSAVSAGQDFDKSMSQVAATMGKTVDEISELRDFAQEMGATTAFSATEAADALNYMALAGYDAETSMAMLPNVLNLAAAGNFDLARASDMVTDTQTAFGISIDRTTQMVDEMAKAASTGNTSVEQLGDAFLTVGGLAQELTGGFVTLADGTKQPVDGIQELEIALTAMANAGIKGNEAGTHMRNMLLKLSSPTDKGAEALEHLGVKVFDADGKMRSLNEIFGDLSTSLGKLTQEEKIQAISEMFNTRDLASAEALLNAVGQDWNEIGVAITEAEGSAEKMAKTQLDNLAGDVTLFKSALEGLRIAVSDGVTPELRNFVQFGTEGLSKLTLALKEGGVAGAMDALGDIIANGLTMLMEKIPSILGAGGKLMTTILDTLLDALPKVMEQLGQFIADNIGSVVDFLLGIVTKLINSFSSIIRPLIRALPKMIKEVLQAVVKNLPLIIQGLIELMIDIVRELPTIISELIANIPTIITMLIDGFINSMPQLVEGCIQLVVELVKHLPEIIAGLIGAIPEILSSILEAFGPLGEMLGGLFSGFLGDIGGILGQLPSTIGPILEEAYSVASGIFEWFGHLMDDPAKALEEAFDGVKNYAVKVFESVQQIITGIFDLIDAKQKEAEARANRQKVEEAKAEKEAEGWAFVDTDGDGSTDWTVRKDSDAYKAYINQKNMGDMGSSSATVTKETNINVNGTIVHEGVNSQGELVGSVEAAMDGIKDELKRDTRRLG